jgi:hypothetical protein
MNESIKYISPDAGFECGVAHNEDGSCCVCIQITENGSVTARFGMSAASARVVAEWFHGNLNYAADMVELAERQGLGGVQ